MSGVANGKGPSTFWFYVLTGVYLVVVIIGAWSLGFFDPTGEPISPSDWGNVLAGVFSPLAFLWLIYASLSQRAELELQRNELAQNNLTQDAQRGEMRRQVDVMTAQAKLLEAQAAATFDPVFILSSSHRSRGGYAISIRNCGCEVLDVQLIGEFSITYYKGGSTGFDSTDNEVFYWEKDVDVSCSLDAPNAEELHELSIQYTRKDGTTRRNVYVVSILEQSMRLFQQEPVL